VRVREDDSDESAPENREEGEPAGLRARDPRDPAGELAHGKSVAHALASAGG
jgi:hypothetical protein